MIRQKYPFGILMTDAIIFFADVLEYKLVFRLTTTALPLVLIKDHSDGSKSYS